MTPWIGLFTLIALAIVSLLISLSVGSTSIPFDQILSSILTQNPPLIREIVLDFRLPRTLSAFVTGGLLALAGALMQILLRNPLADPYILGVSGGSAIFSILFILLGVSPLWITMGAWAGGLLAFLFVLAFNQARIEADRIVLTGIALASGCSAILSFILIISNDQQLHGLLFWLLGDLSDARMPWFESIVLLVVTTLSFTLAPQFNILARGERFAQGLGLHTARLKLQLYIYSALLTAAAVALSGTIGFIGLAVPHVFRLSFGYNHRFLIPGSVLLGGILLTLADTLARSVFAPQQLPVGILTALLGIPILLFLLHKNRPCPTS